MFQGYLVFVDFELCSNINSWTLLTWSYRQIWDIPEADDFYKKQKAHAASTAEKQKIYFFRMMKWIGGQLQRVADLVPPAAKSTDFEALDICMAPGGFTSTVLKGNRVAKVCGLTMPEDEGGHSVLLENWREDDRVNIEFMDITMLSAEMGFPNLVLQDHPSASKFSNAIPYEGRKFDLIFCDGQALASKEPEGEFNHCATRLTCAQLVLALQRIRPGGTMVMLEHQTHRPQVVRLIEAFSHFSRVSLVKPCPMHAKRNSYYLVAKRVVPGHERARRLVRDLKALLGACSAEAFGVDLPKDTSPETDAKENIEDLLESFGDKLVKLATPVWEIQKDALEKQFLHEKVR